MPTENRTDPLKNFVPRLLPWLLAVVALGFYVFTLNHWLTLLDMPAVARVSGWAWQPDVAQPLTFLVTYPFRWLSPAHIPMALNLFSAICAALALALLARSVAILPHDRTEAQRKRERSGFSFLTIGGAWLPPVLAVAMCGLQLTFWEHATNQTGEMLGLLLFAFIVWSLLEYRIDERPGRLYLAALVYGASLAENWAMFTFLPLALAALIWTRKFGFLNLSFLGRMLLCGLAGMSLFLLLPLVVIMTSKLPVSFWEVLKINLTPEWQVIKSFFMVSDTRHTLGLLALTSLLPVFVLSIRWKSSFGDSSQIGIALANFMFHLVHALMLGVCVWVAFDPPISPRHLGWGMPCLPLYFLGALAIGYYCGYFLLIFGRDAVSSRSQRVKPSPFKSINVPVQVAVWTFAAVAIVGLIYKNVPQIRSTNDDTLARYSSHVVENLPASGGYILGDDSKHLFIAQAGLVRAGLAKDFVALDTQSLSTPEYHRYLHKTYPQKWPQVVSDKQNNELNWMGLISVLATLSQSNALYYLHPSFGYYFEQFYLEPRGLVYKLQTLPNDTLLPPPLDKNLFAANEAFWAHAAENDFGPIEQAVTPADPNAVLGLGERLLRRFHVEREPNPNAVLAGTFYSRNLDFWGVQVQRAGNLTNAAAAFELAQRLNPENAVAGINLQFNADLRAGKSPIEDLANTLPDPFGKFTNWKAAVAEDGPYDVPSFCFQEGYILSRGNGFYRQAVAPFERVRQLLPGNLPVRLVLSQLYIANRLPDRALDALREPLAHPEKFFLAESNTTQLNIVAASAYFQKNDNARAIKLLQTEVSRHPDDNELLTATVQAYMARGLYNEALEVVNRKLRATPDDLTWLFGKGYVSIQLKAYDDAIAALNRVLAVQTNNNDARFNRAVAYLNSDKLDAARADYQKLQQTFTNSVPVAYGLGEIAWRKHETNEAVRNYELYLAAANTNTAEAKTIFERLHELKK